ncbi:MAG: helicase-exonuclease AddAB subunit AddA [Lachnospiraceae bacterium]|nr:helicase-exonuclease AddAB subunit AddA [Lachnospiraceae bacterium]
MSEFGFSPDQLKVINTRGKNILVSAAAGSGKTTVLVERIIKKITDKENPVDIDRILVLTFTDAAAAEMRGRIEEALEKAIVNEPDNERLIRQTVLIHNAQISTIHGFCLSLIRNNFSDIGLDPSFRVAETGEVKLVEGAVLDSLINDLFEENDESIELLADRFSTRNTLTGLKEIIHDAYEVCRNSPYVHEYIEERRNDYLCEDKNDILSSGWGKELARYVEKVIDDAIDMTQYNLELVHSPNGAFMYEPALLADLDAIRTVKGCKTYDEYKCALNDVEFVRLSSKKSTEVSEKSKEASKSVREQVKKMINSLKKDFFCMSSEAILRTMRANNVIMNALVDVLIKYDEMLEEEKIRRKIIDFSDMEHYAIRVLMKKQGDTYVPTKTALDYRDFYEEVMVDEYQDSNQVQETILRAISGEANGRYNRFMVGDVKQSIYSFRRACPELFTEKYEEYSLNGENSIRIDLSSNFRSRAEVVDSVNDVFDRLMGKDLGNISYDEAARLYTGAVYPETDEDHTTELLIAQYDDDEKYTEPEFEASLVASRIGEMVGTYKICDKDGIRPCRYSDIVILVRTNKGWDEAFKRVLETNGIPAFIASKTGYFNATEVRELLNMLQILDNPLCDIEMYGILTGVFGGFCPDEIALIRGKNRTSLYDAVKAISLLDPESDTDISDSVIQKCRDFMRLYLKYRERIIYTPINELLEELIHETGYIYHVSSLPYGNQRRSNVLMLVEKAKQYENGSFKGLYHFIRYINEIQTYEVDYGEASMVDEQADVVRIMSIHKSKGLEFPICFISGLAKRFNIMDSHASVVFEKNLGFAMDHLDIEQNVKYTDIRHKTLGRRIRLDQVAEEMRVLYVAMTRAKEKLIMTACDTDPVSLTEKYSVLSAMHSKNSKTLPFSIRSRFLSYLEAVLCSANERSIRVAVVTGNDIELKGILNSVSKTDRKERISNDIINEQKRMEDLTKDSDFGEDFRIAKNQIMFKYPNTALCDLYTKTSVSELKIAAMSEKLLKSETEDEPAFLFAEHDPEKYLPSFISGDEKVTGSARGSAYHRILELFDMAGSTGLTGIDQESQKKYVTNVISKQIRSGKIDKKTADLVDVKKITAFLISDLGRRMCMAAAEGRLKKEQPFVLGINADRLNKDYPKEETVLIQGIIDAFFYEGDDIILMDYKTDAVKNGQELTDRYSVQLEYYKEALETITGKKVIQKLIYSFALGETIELV